MCHNPLNSMKEPGWEGSQAGLLRQRSVLRNTTSLKLRCINFNVVVLRRPRMLEPVIGVNRSMAMCKLNTSSNRGLLRSLGVFGHCFIYKQVAPAGAEWITHTYLMVCFCKSINYRRCLSYHLKPSSANAMTLGQQQVPEEPSAC